MKKKIWIIIPLIIIISIISILILKKDKKDLEYKKSITIEVGKKVPTIDSYTKNKEVSKIKWKDINIEDSKIFYTGKYLGTFIYKNKKYNINLIVIDKEKPVITDFKNIEIYVGEKIDLFKDIVIKDNSHDELSKKIEGKYDINKAGTYELEYVVTDKSGNEAREKFSLKIKEKPIEKNNPLAISDTTKKGYNIENRNGLYYINGILIANKTYSLLPNYNPGGLTEEFNNNFTTMSNEAKVDNINLKIISGFRSYSTQSTLYNNYVSRDGKAAADRYSARAGHSEHQTGLAADINSLEQSFENTKEGKWLNDNCYKYGFIIRYPKGKEASTGYMFEPWHIRYVGKELATKLYNNGNWITLEEYLGIDSKYN